MKDDRWLHFSDYLAHTTAMITFPYECVDGYMKWLYVVSHPFMIPPQDDEPPRQPPHMPVLAPVVPDLVLVMPQPAPSDIPQHARGVCAMIADRLQHVLDLHTILATSEEYTIIEQCVVLAQGVTDDGNVYIRQRRRRR